MTPEERAEAYIEGPHKTHMFPDDYANAVARLSAMIRAAVAEEREACATIEETLNAEANSWAESDEAMVQALGTLVSPDFWHGHDSATQAYAAAIRARTP